MLNFYSGSFCIFRRAKLDTGEGNGSNTPQKSRRRRSRLGIMVKDTASNRVGSKGTQQIKVQPCPDTSSFRKTQNLQKFDDLYKNTPLTARNKYQSHELKISRRRSGRGRRLSLMVAAINSDRNIFGSTFSKDRKSGVPQEQSIPRYEGPSRRWTLTAAYPVSVSNSPYMLTPVEIIDGTESPSTAHNFDISSIEAIAAKANQMKPDKLKPERSNDRSARRSIPKRRASGRSTRLSLLTADFLSQPGNNEEVNSGDRLKPRTPPRRRSLFWSFWPFSPAHSGSTSPTKPATETATGTGGVSVTTGLRRSTIGGTPVQRRRSLSSVDANKTTTSHETFHARLASVHAQSKATPALNSVASIASTESPVMPTIQQREQQEEKQQEQQQKE